MRRLWKIGAIAAGGVGLLAGTVASLPHIVDVEAYRPAIVEAVRQATGRELVIDGPLKLRMFPVPGIGAGKVRFANAVGAKGAQMVDVRWVSVRPSWRALLDGRIEVGQLILYRPTIVLETDAQGRPNWDFSPADQPKGAPSSGLRMAIGSFSIVHGTVRYTDPKTGQTLIAEEVEAAAKVGSLDGPFSLAGRAKVNGVPLDLALDVGPPTAKGNDVTLKVEVSSGQLAFVGGASRIALDASIDGHLRVATGLLTDFTADLVRATGGEMQMAAGRAIGRFSFDGGFALSPDRLAIEDFTMSMGGETAQGSLSVTPQPIPTIAGHVSLATLDLGRWLALADNPVLRDLVAAKPSDAPQAKAPKPSPLPEINVSLALSVGRVLYRGDAIRDLALKLDMQKGVIAVPDVRATLPGDLKLETTADGRFSFAGARLRETLDWLGVDVSAVPKDRLQRLAIAGRIRSVAGKAQLSDATFDLDDIHGTGAASATLALPIDSTVQVTLDRVDLDAYLPKPIATSTATEPAANPAAAAPPASFGLKAKVAKLLWRGETLSGVDLDAAVLGNRLKLNDLRVAYLLGGRLGLRGTIDDYGRAPRFDLGFNVSTPNADRLLDYFALPKFANGKIGAATASGGLSGTMAALTLSNVAAEFQGASARLSGRLAFTKAVDFDFPSFTLRAQEMSRLVSLASGRPASPIGPLALAGALKGNSRRTSFTGEIDAVGAKMTGSLEATLGARPLVTANLKVPSLLDIDKLMGVSAQPLPAAPRTVTVPDGKVPVPAARATTAKPIDLTGMRAFDAVLTLRTTAMTVASLKIDYADLDASLTRGVLKIGRLTGQFYGGSVDFSGLIDGSGPALAVNLQGDVRGIYLGEMLRGTAGTSSFGNSNLTVAVDGKLDATGIRLGGSGSSPAEIRNALTGSASLGGFVYPKVTQGSRSLALFATGLGSLFSSNMALDSTVLRGFVDRPSNLNGRLQLHGGTVSLENDTVQGQGATAYVVSRTSLPASTTDTTIRVAGGNGHFVVTLKGPLASPEINTARAAPDR